MKNKKMINSLLTLTALLVVSCAKDKPFDMVYREAKVLQKSSFATHEVQMDAKGQEVMDEDGKPKMKPIEYIYVPMTLGTPMDVVEADPFYQGQEKVVRLEWAEEGLKVLEIERDDRFDRNDLNEFTVLTIPGDHKDYRCKEDAYGECTNVEEENTEVEWYDKKSFLAKFEDLKVEEVNQLNLFTLNDSCLSEEGTKVRKAEVNPGVINIELEVSYKVKATWKCAINSLIEDNMSMNGFRVRKFFSLVRLDSLVSKDYEAVAYPDPDHSTFGFFNREEKVLNGEFDRWRKEKRILMERWNPNRANNELVYYLSPEFSLDEYAYIKEATYETVAIMNQEMVKSNIPFTIKLIEQDDPETAVSPGDLRYNSLVLITDPLANGLLGYGPAVSNPYTGEIIKAHTNMYLGVLTSLTRRVYQAAVDLSVDQYEEEHIKPMLQQGAFTVNPNALIPKTASGEAGSEAVAMLHFPEQFMNGERPEAKTQTGDQTAPPSEAQVDEVRQQATAAPFGGAVKIKELAHLIHQTGHRGHNHGSLQEHDHGQVTDIAHQFDVKSIKEKLTHRLHEKRKNTAAMRLRMLKESGELTDEEEYSLKEEARLDRYAENNAYATEFFPIAGTSKIVYPEIYRLENIQTNKGTLKPWTKLNQDQKDFITKMIVKKSYQATLIHELGHNLGLRHNFMGSYDKENFFTDKEARALGMTAAPAYSSIMDYSFSEFNQLKAFGKYDLAALRFGYAREIEVLGPEDEEGKRDSKFKKITGTVTEFDAALETGEERKSYEFCTDENAGLSTNCNRFDEGTSLVEITRHLIKRYNDAYKYRNFRDGRLDYSAYDDLRNYIYGRRFEFTRIRDVLEEYEFFAGLFGREIMTTGCSPQEEANNVVCQWLRDRIDAVNLVGTFFRNVLLTPDHICALAEPENPTEIVEYRPLGEILEDLRIIVNYEDASCFNPLVVNKLKDDPGFRQTPKVVVGETGKFLNGFKDADRNYRYVTDRAILGTWPDKVMAFRALFARKWGKSNTDRGHLSLMDVPAIQQIMMPVLSHYALGTPTGVYLPMETKNGSQFVVPYAINDDYQVENVEDLFRRMRGSLNLPKAGGNESLLKMAFHQIERQAINFGVEFTDDAFQTRSLLAVAQNKGWIPEQDRKPTDLYLWDEDTEILFSANKNTPFATEILESILGYELLKTVDKELVAKVLKQRTELPEAPADLADEDLYFWKDVTADQKQQLINIAADGNTLNEEVLADIFGEEGAKKVIKVFGKGAPYMQEIVDTISAIQNTPADDATDAEKELFEISEQTLERYAMGVLNDEVVEHYKLRLRNLPKYIARPI